MDKRMLGLFASIVLVLVIASVGAFGAGFALVEQSAKGIGHAFAGAAADTEDPSAMYFNPANIAGMEGSEVVVGSHVVAPSFEFENEGSTPVGGGNGGDAGVTKVVPNFYYTQGLNQKMNVGLGLNVPFGLVTDYDSDWIGRYSAIRTELETLNINPSIAMMLTDNLYAGVGFNAMYAEAELTSAYATPMGDIETKMNGDDWGYGYNIGLTYLFDRGTRLGVGYRSQVDQELEGDLKYAGVMPKENVRADLDLPASVSMGLHRAIGDWASVMLGMTWTEWSSFEELAVYNDRGELRSYTDENWEDNMRYSLGFNYFLDPDWVLRCGVAYDETPVPDMKHRTARIPDADRIWTSAGVGYTFNESLSLDAGYTHLFIHDSDIAHRYDQQSGSKLEGEYTGDADTVSLQLNWKI